MKRAEALRQEVMKLPGGKRGSFLEGKEGSFPVEKEEASQWKGGSFTAGREKALQWKVMKLFSGKHHGKKE